MASAITAPHIMITMAHVIHNRRTVRRVAWCTASRNWSMGMYVAMWGVLRISCRIP